MLAMCVLLAAHATDWMRIEGIGFCSFIMCIKKCRERMSADHCSRRFCVRLCVLVSQLIYRAATLPSARKARSHLPFQGRYIRPAEG